MSEHLSDFDWTELIQEAGSDWTTRRAKSPVVILTYPHGLVERGVLGPLIRERDKTYVGGIDLEISERGTQSLLFYQISLDELRVGEITRGSDKVKIKFDGLASDEKHSRRKWSFTGK